MSELESAEDFACKRIPYIRKAADGNIDLLESVLARDIEARDNAVRVALLDEIRAYVASAYPDSGEAHRRYRHLFAFLDSKYQTKDESDG